MADITLRAAYGAVVEEDGQLCIGFAEGDGDEDGYVMVRQPLAGGPTWLEVNDEAFGATDAIASVRPTPTGILITIKPDQAARFGWATTIAVRIDAETDDAASTLAVLAECLGPVWQA